MPEDDDPVAWLKLFSFDSFASHKFYPLAVTHIIVCLSSSVPILTWIEGISIVRVNTPHINSNLIVRVNNRLMAARPDSNFVTRGTTSLPYMETLCICTASAHRNQSVLYYSRFIKTDRAYRILADY